MDYSLYAMYLAQIISCVILGVLACVFPKDLHLERRDYLVVSQAAAFADSSTSNVAGSSASLVPANESALDARDLIARTQLEFVSKVSGQVNYDLERNLANFQLVSQAAIANDIKEKAITNRSYTEFRELEC